LATIAPGDAAETALAWPRVLDRFAALPIPSVAVLHGYAMGGGFLISLYCDVRVAATGTRLGFPTSSRMWLPPWRMARLAGWLGLARTQQMLLAAPEMDAAEAQRWGLVDEVAPAERLDELADRTAERLAFCRREVVAEARQFFAQLAGQPHAAWDRLSAAAF